MLVAAGPAIASVVLLGATALSWLLPVTSTVLDFSEAEMQWLFPAPVSRRSLLMHRLMRSQLGILFGAIVVGIVTPSVTGVSRVRVGVAAWALLTIGKVYFTIITLARARLGSPDAAVRRLAWLPVVVNLAAVVIVGAGLARAFMAGPVTELHDALDRVGAVATFGPSAVVLWPFATAARPLFAPWPGPFLGALGGAVLVFVPLVAWMLYSDDAFQDAVADPTQTRAAGPSGRTAAYRARSTGWTLAAAGRPEGAFAWKAAMQTLRIVDRRTVSRFAFIVIAVAASAAAVSRATHAGAIAWACATGVAAFAVVLAPQVLRVDMRQDLRHLELLKTWPVKPSAVLRGELAWPGLLLTAVAWAMIVVAVGLSHTVFESVAFGVRVSVGVASAVLAPALVFAQLAIHNGVALVFPAWVPLGNQRPRGLDAMGQRLIVLGGTWLLLLVMLVPGALAGGVVWFLLRRLLGTAAMILAAISCTAVVAAEVLVATEALGPAYDSLDILSVDRSE
jgi:hypothetical protein